MERISTGEIAVFSPFRGFLPVHSNVMLVVQLSLGSPFPNQRQ